MNSFSQRHGYWGLGKDITVREDAPESLRVVSLLTASELGLRDIRSIVCRVLRVRPDPGNWSAENVWREVEYLVYGCEWFKVYDIIEAFQKAFFEQHNRQGADFVIAINQCFIEEGIGWQLENGKIATRGDEAFQSVTKKALEEISSRPTAKSRIEEALNDLSRRPKPDLSGAISHAFAAMESVVGSAEYTPEDIRGGTHHTFGAYLTRHPDLFPSDDVKEGFQRLWKYANNEGGRHGKEGIEPLRDEAEFIVSLAAALITYLNRKYPM